MAKTPSLTDMLAALDGSPAAPSTPEEIKQVEMRMLPDEEKWRQAWGWKMQGVPLANIAKIFGVDVRTVGRWIQSLKRQFRESFEGETAADVLAGFLMKYESIEEVCRYEASQMSKEGKQFDPTTGKITENKNALATKGKQAAFIKLALEAAQAQMKLLQDVGVLPTHEPERMYKSMEQEGKLKAEEASTAHKPMDRAESIGIILKNLSSSRTM